MPMETAERREADLTPEDLDCLIGALTNIAKGAQEAIATLRAERQSVPHCGVLRAVVGR